MLSAVTNVFVWMSVKGFTNLWDRQLGTIRYILEENGSPYCVLLQRRLGVGKKDKGSLRDVETVQEK